MKTEVSNQFLVALGDLKLSENQRENIQSGIQSVVMKELAQMDNLDNFTLAKRKTGDSILKLKPGLINGFYFDGLRKELLRVYSKASKL
jgi:hypothetical protein